MLRYLTQKAPDNCVNTRIGPERERWRVPGSRYCGSRGGSCGKRAHLFLHLPGAAPSEPGRAAARRTLVAQQVGSLPQLPREAEHWQPVFGSVLATRGVPTCWRGSWVREAGAEPPQRFFCDALPGAGGRRPVAKEGAAQKDRNGPTLSRICAGEGVGHSFAGEAA